MDHIGKHHSYGPSSHLVEMRTDQTCSAFSARYIQIPDGFQATSTSELRRLGFFERLVYQQWSLRTCTQSTETGREWLINSMCDMIRAKSSHHLVNSSSIFIVVEADVIHPEYCYQYRCGWDTGVSFIHCVRTRRQTTYFCINCPSSAVKRLRIAAKKEPSIGNRDFFIDALVADESLKQWQSEIGRRRELLQSYVCAHLC